MCSCKVATQGFFSSIVGEIRYFFEMRTSVADCFQTTNLFLGIQFTKLLISFTEFLGCIMLLSFCPMFPNPSFAFPDPDFVNEKTKKVPSVSHAWLQLKRTLN